jgi:ABC-type sugar transport system substrate-binding protein
MKKIFILLQTVGVVVALFFAGCMPGAPPVAPPEAPPEAAEIPQEPAGVYAQPNPMWGVAIKPDGTPYRFEHVCPILGYDWMVCVNGVMTSLIERAGGEVTTTDADGVIDRQFASFDDAILKKPDAIFTSTVLSSEAFWPYIDRATAAGIPVFEYDAYSGSENTVFGSTYDTESQGELCAQVLVNAAQKSGKHLYIYHIWGNMNDVSDRERYDGFKKVVDEHQDDVTLQLESPTTMWAPEETGNVILDAFPTHPELNALCTQSDCEAAVCEALRTIGRLYPVGHPDHVAVSIAFCGWPESLPYLREGFIDGGVEGSPWEIGNILVDYMLTYVCLHKPVPKVYRIKDDILTLEMMENPPYGAPMIWSELLTAEPNFDKWPILDLSELGIETPTLAMK